MLELGGARQDATDLWALFTDTLPGLSARLLVDETATCIDVSQALLGRLSSALPDDVVVITFAGDGSPEGHLVLYDTDGSNLAGTALPMSVLADAFRDSKARAILCILDCCFSGQAPARVLEGAARARARSAFAFNGIYGIAWVVSCWQPVLLMSPLMSSRVLAMGCSRWRSWKR
jgi:helicase